MTWLSRVVPAVTFLVGLLLGGLGVWLTAGDESPDTNAAQDTPSASPPTATSPPTTITVPAACAEAGREAEQAVGLMRDAAAAVRDVRPGDLAELLNSLEDSQLRLEELAQQCSAVEAGTAE